MTLYYLLPLLFAVSLVVIAVFIFRVAIARLVILYAWVKDRKGGNDE